MPLLRKKPFEKVELPANIRDDEEVFYCAATDEVFRDYEEFSERMFLCNSMVWTCALTGKTNLTYAEAMESEKNARHSLKGFPPQLKIPILYLAEQTKRTAFGDMAEDVFMYAKDRYFIGENVETSFTGSKWKDSHVLQVIAPTAEQLKKSPRNGNVDNHHSFPPASLYKYEIEHLDLEDKDISEIMIVDFNQIRRKKGSFSREKCKLFLKQYVEQDDRSTFVIKQLGREAFNLDKLTFDKIFVGPAPQFHPSKKLEKIINGKKMRQESLHKFLTKKNHFPKNENDLTKDNCILLEKMKKREEEYKLLKQQKKEEQLAEKQKKKEENLMLAGQVRDWYKPKEDLELVDQKKLPTVSLVKLKIPDAHVGDILMVLEFVHSFSKLLSTKDFFPNGLTLEIMERALTENEVAGPYIDLIQMLLSALFNVQDGEASQYRTETETLASIKQEDISDNMNLREATRLATLASSWSKKYQGLPLGQLPLYSLTTSEILRLHLLGSGAIINMTGAKWRYQQRGGYTSEDDPGLYLRVHSPNILKALRIHYVVELPIGDKLKILSCLIDQLLTYADVRDVVDERMDKIRQAKTDYKTTLMAEKKREQEFQTARCRLKKEAKANPKALNELHQLTVEADQKRAENERQMEEYKKASYEKQVVMGQDRAFRQYLKLESVPGFFVNADDENSGACLSRIVEQNQHLVNANRDEILAYLKKTMHETSSSDKENSPSPKKVNGVHNGIHDSKTESYDDLMLCSSDPEKCVVHVRKEGERWCFYQDTDALIKLTESLNKRGVRESELYTNIKNNVEEIEQIITDTPCHHLNTELVDNLQSKRLKRMGKYENANLGYSTDMSPEDVLHSVLIENILEMEEKIFAGSLGMLFVKDRDKWRTCIQNRNYADLDKSLRAEESSNNDSETNVYQDPGDLLTAGNDLMPDIDNNDVLLTQRDDIKNAIKSLAIALAQIAEAVEPKFLKKPLGRIHTGRNDKKKEAMLKQWKESLLASTSFSQVFLHYSTLDSCVTWGKSVLLARCRICRRKNDSENMLLCDSCNLGHHLSCLKPKLKSVPSGDWFCSKCQKERKAESPIEPPPKKRPIFRDEEIEEEESEEEDVKSDDESNSSEEVEEEEDQDETYAPIPGKIDTCKICGSGGEVIFCDKCSNCYHIECTEPPLRRAPRGLWLCAYCKKNDVRKRRYETNYLNGTTRIVNGQRRCAAKALYKIHDFIKSLRHLSESDDSSEEEVISKRSTRREEGRSDLPLHNSALHAVLAEIMKDSNAWPFLRPVQKTEVPDYYDVITKPMDFGTIKYKLNMGEYKEDAQFMSDALLIFQNCNTYNHTEDDVYKCGVQLLKHFQKKCRELGLKLPEEMDYNDSCTRPKKKIRTK